MLNFRCFFVLFNAMKTDIELTLHHMGKIFIIYLTKIKFKIWKVSCEKKFPLKNLGMDVRFSCNWAINHVRTKMRWSLGQLVVRSSFEEKKDHLAFD